MPTVDRTKEGKVDPGAAIRTARSRRSAARSTRLDERPVGRPVVGIDPGARYTGVVVRDGDAVLHASTLVRPDAASATDWAVAVTVEAERILRGFPAGTPVGVEGVSDPKGFNRGQRAAINPRDIIRAAVVLGAVVATWPSAIVVPPGGNGSQHYTHYPASLIGRRPAALPGSTNNAGTRDHEQSAYDVAGKAARVAYPPRRHVI